MRPDEYTGFDATGLAELVHRGEITPQELAESAIERIELLNGKLNAVVERSYEMGRSAAAGVQRDLPLAGVPFLAKDMNIEVAGLHLTSSCRWLASLPPAATDAPLAARWRRAGLSILGRTNTPEFAGEFVTEPRWRGPTCNPWDLSRSPGGSSGGAASAVASGMVPLAHGTDSGGSIRVPAAACGLVGLKPSRGWVPVGPRHDELAGGLDCEHVLSRSVRDTALMLDLTSGVEPGSRYPCSPQENSFSRAVHEPSTPLRIGIAVRAPGGSLPVEDIGAAFEEAAALLASAGHRITKFEYPDSATNTGDPAAIIWMSATAEEIDFFRRRLGYGPRQHELEALSWACVALAERTTAIDYERARRALSAASRDMANAFESIDVLLLPTTSQCAVPTGSIDGRTENFDLERWNDQSYGYAPYTELFNVTGQPAISLPLAQSRTGLPIGLQILAAPFAEEKVFRVARMYERETEWHRRRPVL